MHKFSAKPPAAKVVDWFSGDAFMLHALLPNELGCSHAHSV
jgi:hypothetical protein